MTIKPVDTTDTRSLLERLCIPEEVTERENRYAKLARDFRDALDALSNEDARCAVMKKSGMTRRPPPGSRPRAVIAVSISASLRTGALLGVTFSDRAAVSNDGENDRNRCGRRLCRRGGRDT
jgi:hypothetical protein